MATRMLIDARHPEETRVAVLKGNRIEEFDFESAEHKQIKGNIYLAKVTRVEPSLQAAFVDFGGNRHGFLAFSEIHPDYYQIPAEDRDALLAEELAHAEEEAALRADDEDDDDDYAGDYASDRDEDDDDAGVEEIDTSEKDDVATIEDGQVESDEDEDDSGEDDSTEDEDGNADSDEDEESGSNDGGRRSQNGRRPRGRRQGQGQGRRGGGNSRAKEMDELRAKRQALRRRYKIQDVIQRRQVLLVQVVKEERGNKGAALTSYLSLAGRYCVLMPNSSHGGGISRKISNGSDRKRLKQIVGELSLPKSMGLIVRTAGLQRNKTEIKRDFDYLARLWDEIRENTLKSSAPALIHSDSDLIKRAIRDIYNREIEEVVVEGEEGYKLAKSFMKLLMPSHARRVKAYSDPVPLFQRYGAEDQLSAMYDPVVQLKSGGYLVINPTEALVSIDINSGRSTKEHGIEQTATATNLEAAREIARQLRLRDMAGLVVIDFIDMEHNSNVRKVERCMKDSLKNDRARIQVGRISGFGLMEMSRQRLRTGVLEATTRSCPHCDGTGLVRTASSAGLSALRLIEDEAAKGKGTTITLFASTEAAIYLLNAKRGDLAEIEMRYGVNVEVVPEGEDEGAKMRVNSSGPRPTEAPKFAPLVFEEDDLDIDDEDEDDEEESNDSSESDSDSDEDADGRKKRRRRRRGGRGRNRSRGQDENGDNDGEGDRDNDRDSDRDDDDNSSDDDGESRGSSSDRDGDRESGEDGEDRPRKRRRRGGRGRGRRRNEAGGQDGEQDNEPGESGETSESDDAEAAQAVEPQPEAEAAPDAAEETTAAEEIKPKRRSRRKKVEPEAEATAEEAVAEAPAETPAETAAADTAEPEAEAKPKAKRAPRRKKAEPAKTSEEAPAEAAAPAEEAPAKAKRAPRRKKADAPAAKEAVSEAPLAEEAAKPASAPAKASAPAAAPVAEKQSPAPNDESELDENGEPRRGWWQRTFGA
ncbi:hypothetical protein GCM10009127_21260 [Alteraurantiacibacter aestuarii]|uniref:Rne/Rng family ribonuclease n=1 Tax=Alteraurantiacibacter aestuarii TaxID=650004 RepID=UPI0031DD1DAC